MKVFACVNAKKNMSIDKSFWNSIEKVLGHQVFASVKAKKNMSIDKSFWNSIEKVLGHQNFPVQKHHQNFPVQKQKKHEHQEIVLKIDK